MRKWLKNSSLIILFISWLPAQTQDIPIGTWRTHVSYQSGKLIASSSDKVFCATKNGFFSYDLIEHSIQPITKITGLSDVGITALTFDSLSQTLVIGYQSGLIDIITKSKILTCRSLKTSTLVFDKQINDVEVRGNICYAACGLGIITVSLTTAEITDNFRAIGTNGADVSVSELVLGNDNLFALSELGIQKGNISANLLDFNKWELIASDTSAFKSLVSDGFSLFTIQDQNKIIRFQNGQWNKILDYGSPILKIKSINNELYFLTNLGVYQLIDSTVTPVWEFEVTKNPSDFLVGSDVWIADVKEGLITQGGQSIFPNGPLKDEFTNLRYLDKKIYGFYGPAPSDYTGSYDSLGYEVYNGITWEHTPIEGFYNLSDVALFKNVYYFSSIGMGVYSSAAGPLTSENSTLEPGLDGQSIVVPSLAFQKNKLWAILYNHSYSIHQMSDNLEWSRISNTLTGTTYPEKLSLSSSGIAWIKRGTLDGNGISTFDASTSIHRIISTGAGLPSSSVNKIQISLEDEAWIATEKGIVNYPVASLPFEGFDLFSPFFENDLLFESESITALATDGGNRLWVAARNQLWVYDASFSKLEYVFSEENSPLPSGQIKDLIYNPSNGEMFILTSKGLVSFRSNSSLGSPIHYNVQIFPNPVRPDFNGDVGITGVATNAILKITDLSGRLIRQIQANGGTGSWDLRDFNGTSVDTGVYFFISASSDGTDTFIGKIAVIRR